MATVRFKAEVSDNLEYSSLDTIEDSISVVRGFFTTGNNERKEKDMYLFFGFFFS